jgi:Flp pilus assembly protein TadD
MATCAKCKQDLPPEANFCPNCGQSLQSSAVSAMIDDARQTLSSDPGDAAARYNLAIAYKLGGVDDLALEELEQVATLQPDFADAYYEMGLLHAKSGSGEKAVSSLKRALELDSNHSRAHKLLARLQEGD